MDQKRLATMKNAYFSFHLHSGRISLDQTWYGGSLYLTVHINWTSSQDQGRFEMCEKCMCSTKAGVCSTMVKSVSICQIALTLTHVSDMLEKSRSQNVEKLFGLVTRQL